MNMRNKNKLSNTNLLDAIFNDGLQDAYSKEAMGVSGDKTARKYEISRDEQDDFAIQSYKRSAKAWEEGKLDRKSTRLNSSHVAISYAVFCLKKKKGEERTRGTRPDPGHHLRT